MGVLNNDSIEELMFTQRLADVENAIRMKAIKKLKTFLQVKSLRGFTYDDFIKIWKGLYYCMYMSDKPLIQEDLAENISCLIHQLASHSQKILFFKVALDTFVREWNGIDKFRLDKFLMLYTRVLRQCLVFLRDIEWDKDEVKNTSDVLEASIVCPFDDTNTISLGLKMHLVDVLLEELAKVGRESLPDRVLFTLMNPFLKALAASKQPTYVTAIENGIILALIKQSDLGIENQEDLALTEFEVVKPKKVLEVEEEEEEEEEENFAMDPRAGGVDVNLPQLKPDYKEVSNLLIQFGSIPEVSNQRRKRIYDLSKMFLKLEDNIYPLVQKIELPKEIKRKDIVAEGIKRLMKSQRMSAKRKLEDESEPSKKKRKLRNKNRKRKNKNNKKMNEKDVRKMLKEQRKSEINLEKKLSNLANEIGSRGKISAIKSPKPVLIDSFEVTVDTSSDAKKKKVNKPDLEWKIKKIVPKSADSNKILKGKKRKAKTTKLANKPIALDQAKINKEESCPSNKICTTPIPTLNLEKYVEAPKQKKRKGNKKSKGATKEVSNVGQGKTNVVSSTNSNLSKKTKANKKDPWSEPLKEGEIEIVIPAKKLKKNLKKKTKMNMVIKKTPNVNTRGKTLKINLGQNKEHDIHDYTRVLKSSPGIPFSAHKKPSVSVLKTTKSPILIKRSCSNRINLMKTKYYRN